MENTLNKPETRTMLALCVYDKKGQQYLAPFCASNEPVGIRTFHDLINNPNTPMHKHPEDFCLYCVGTFSEFTGELQPSEIKFVCDAQELVGLK